MMLRSCCAALLLLCCLLIAAAPARAQTEYTVEGRVLEAETDDPIPGVNIRFEETTQGTATDVDGTFSFTASLEPGDYMLAISFVGYRPVDQPVTLGDETTVDVGTVQLREDIVRSEEIVVTGTGVPTERRKLGNVIGSVDAAEIEQSGAAAIDQALAGKVPGVVVNQNSGGPAGGVSVSLRGTSTILGSGQPLYVVDGVIVNNDSPVLLDLGGGAQNRLVDISPEDIERIEVVKGAAAAALYGSRANNGVVQIFTKRGQSGVPRVTFKSTLRTERVRKTLDVNMAQNGNGAFIGNGGEPLPDEADGSAGRRYDWQDNIFRRAYGTEQYLSVTGGTEQTKYAASGSHLGNQGIENGTFFRRFNGRARIDQAIADWADLSVGARYSYSKSQDVPNGGLTSNYGALTGFIFGPNTFDIRPNDEGEYLDQGILANPLDVIDRFDFTQETRRFIGDFKLALEPVENFGIDYVLGYDSYDQVALGYIPIGSTANGLEQGQARRATQQFIALNNDLRLQYVTDLTDGVESTTLLGGSLQWESTEQFSAQGTDLIPFVRVVQGGLIQATPGESRVPPLVLYGAFGQQTFGLGDRLFLTGALRLDASNAFGQGERWQYYPKVSGSYILSDEGFWKNAGLNQYASSFKLRGALGYSGGITSIGTTSRFTLYSPNAYADNAGFLPSTQLGAIDVKPERQREIELGADLGFFDGRVALEATYYNQHTDDLLLFRSVAPTSGYNTRLDNIGTLDNQGIELLLRALPVSRSGFDWTTTVTFAANRPEVNDLEESPLVVGGFGLVALLNGEPPGVFYGAAFERNDSGTVVDVNGNPLERDDDGYWRLASGSIEDEGDGIPQRAFVDENDNGLQDEGEVLAGPEIIGDPNPDWTASWINEFDVGSGFSLRAQVDVVYGQDVFNFTRRLAALSAFGTLDDFQRELEGDLPAGYNAALFNLFENWVEGGSYAKLRELSVAYTLRPASLPVRNIRVRLTGRNLFSIDSYSGYDPETNVGGQRNLVRGFDFVEIPIPRTFSLGVTVGL